jgi:hypothetical protein
MAIHNETLGAQRPPHPEPIYYCATGDETPLYEPCKEMKDQRDIYCNDVQARIHYLVRYGAPGARRDRPVYRLAQ